MKSVDKQLLDSRISGMVEHYPLVSSTGDISCGWCDVAIVSVVALTLQESNANGVTTAAKSGFLHIVIHR
jgi:hypothetical protein